MRIVMMGTGTFAEPTFLKLLEAFPGEVVGLVTQPDREVGRRSGSSRQTGVGMGTIAKSHNIPVIQPASINSDEGVSLLAAMNPDLCVVAAYGQIFKAAALAIPKLGFVNVHASLLPKYRGAAPVAHAILNGETETGVTIFRITTGIDTGEMLAKDSVTIGETETTGELEARLSPIGAELIVEVIQRMKAGPVEGEKQDTSLATRAPKITKEMGLIDWQQDSIFVARQVRAMQPWPTAFTYLHRMGTEPLRLALIAVEASDCDVSLKATPTSWGWVKASTHAPLTRIPQVTLIAHSGDDWLTIHRLQIAGKKPVTAAEFLRGYSLPEGSCFGPEQL